MMTSFDYYDDWYDLMCCKKPYLAIQTKLMHHLNMGIPCWWGFIMFWVAIFPKPNPKTRPRDSVTVTPSHLICVNPPQISKIKCELGDFIEIRKNWLKTIQKMKCTRIKMCSCSMLTSLWTLSKLIIGIYGLKIFKWRILKHHDLKQGGAVVVLSIF